MEYMVRLTCIQDCDSSRSKWEERPCDGACHRCVTELKGLTRADGQEGDQLPARIRSTIKEEPCWLVAKFMVAGEGEATLI